MEGVTIYANNHKVFSTQFDNPLRAALAIDTALATTSAVAWVPSLLPDHRAHGDDSESESDSDDEEKGNGWIAKGSSARAAGGLAVVQILRRGLRYIAPIAGDVDPLVPLTFLGKLHEVLESYIGGPATEASLKDHFDIVLPLLEEMLASGRPLLTSTSQLKELVLPPAKAFANLANAAGLGSSVGSGIGPTGPAGASSATALISSPLPWRRAGIKHSNNEIYFDVTETLSVILSSTSTVLSGTLTGVIACRSKLSGMPDLVLSFGDPGLLDDMAAHPCVRSGRWKKDKVVSFIPPEGAFTLLTYLVPFPTAVSLSAPPPLPFSLKPVITQGALGGTFSLALTCRSLAPLSNLKLRLPLGKGVTGITGAVSGGGFPTATGKGGGAGRWDTEVDLEGFVVLVWDIEELRTGDRVAVLQGQFLSVPGSRTAPALTVTFDCADAGFSGIRIAGLKVAGNSEGYSIYKGVRVRGKGDAEVRCV